MPQDEVKAMSHGPDGGNADVPKHTVSTSSRVQPFSHANLGTSAPSAHHPLGLQHQQPTDNIRNTERNFRALKRVLCQLADSERERRHTDRITCERLREENAYLLGKWQAARALNAELVAKLNRTKSHAVQGVCTQTQLCERNLEAENEQLRTQVQALTHSLNEAYRSHATKAEVVAHLMQMFR